MERRKISDFWAKLLFYLNIAAWILLFFMLLVFHRAQPEFESVFDRYYHLQLRTHWDIQYLYYLVYIVITAIAISLSGLLLSLVRGRRENDHKKVLILVGIVSLIMLFTFMSVL